MRGGIIQKLTLCDTLCTLAPARCPRGEWRNAASDVDGPDGCALAALALPAAAQARPATAAKDGRPNILVVMTDDQAHGRPEAHAERQAPARRGRARPSPTRSTRSRSAAPRARPSSPASTPTTTACTGNFWPFGWYGMKHRANTLPTLAAEGRLPHGADRQVAQRLRRARRPRRGAGRLRHLARPARCVGLRLLQLRDEPRRRPQDLGRRRLRAQAGRVREDPGDPQRRGRGGRVRRAERHVRARPLRLLGGRRTPRTTRPT